jgi:hypothetical protein
MARTTIDISVPDLSGKRRCSPEAATASAWSSLAAGCCGRRLVLPVRDRGKGEARSRRSGRGYPGRRSTLHSLDLASLESVAAFSGAMLREGATDRRPGQQRGRHDPPEGGATVDGHGCSSGRTTGPLRARGATDAAACAASARHLAGEHRGQPQRDQLGGPAVGEHTTDACLQHSRSRSGCSARAGPSQYGARVGDHEQHLAPRRGPDDLSRGTSRGVGRRGVPRDPHDQEAVRDGQRRHAETAALPALFAATARRAAGAGFTDREGSGTSAARRQSRSPTSGCGASRTRSASRQLSEQLTDVQIPGGHGGRRIRRARWSARARVLGRLTRRFSSAARFGRQPRARVRLDQLEEMPFP